MISKKLEDRVLFQWREDRRLNREEQALIDRAVRKLVLLMRAYETHGIASRETIEEAVLRAFEKCEYMYYALDENEIMSVIKMEARNERYRRNH